jgi:hypothetical protein
MATQTQTRTLKLNVVGDSASGRKALADLTDEGDRATGKIGESFGHLFSTLGGDAGGFLGPVGEAFNVLGEKADDLSGKHLNLTEKIGITGTAAQGLGAILLAVSSKDQQAQAQLQGAIENTGHSYADYEDEIDRTIKRQENFGHSADETMRALQSLTQATGDPQKALDDLGVATDLAAAKHEDLDTAVQQVIQILAGKGTKTLAQFGLTTADVAGNTHALASAQTEQQRALDKLHDAQQKLSDLETVLSGKKKLSISDEIHLREARDRVTQASNDLTTANEHVADAQAGVSSATQDQSGKLDELDDKIKNQAQQSMDGFGNKLDIIKTKIEDQVSEFGQRWGPSLAVAGTAVQTLSAVIDIGRATMDLFRGSTELASAAAGLSAGPLGAEAGAVGGAGVAAGGAAPELFAAAAGSDAVALAAAGAAGGADLAGSSFFFMAAGEGAALWPLALLAIAVVGIGIAAYELATHWSEVWNWIQREAADAWNWLKRNVIDPMTDFFNHIPNPSHWAGSVKDAFTSHLPSLHLDSGGIVTGPTAAMLSVNSVPEAVIPLPELPKIMAETGVGGQKPVHQTVVVHAQTNASPRQIARDAAWEMKTMASGS